MTTNQILNLDYREKENQEKIQKVLRLIKPLSKFSDEEYIPLEGIEKAIRVMIVKYNFRVHNITPDVFANTKEIIYRASVVDESNLNELGNVYGISVYELFAKICIKLYSIVKAGNIGLRKPDEHQNERDRKLKKNLRRTQ